MARVTQLLLAAWGRGPELLAEGLPMCMAGEAGTQATGRGHRQSPVSPGGRGAVHGLCEQGPSAREGGCHVGVAPGRRGQVGGLQSARQGTVT